MRCSTECVDNVVGVSLYKVVLFGDVRKDLLFKISKKIIIPFKRLLSLGKHAQCNTFVCMKKYQTCRIIKIRI